MKKPRLAALLNLVPLPLPLGYTYLGRWERAIGFFFVRCGVVVGGLLFGAAPGLGQAS